MTADMRTVRTYITAESASLASACTACGRCVEVCPVVPHAGIDVADATAVVTGVLALLLQQAPPAGDSAAWVAQCNGCGECIHACPEGINPRKMLILGQAVSASQGGGVPQIYRKMARSVRLMAAMQLVPEEFAKLFRLQRVKRAPVVFYLGCNALRTPHMLLNAMFVLDTLGVDYEVIGGPASCCGIVHTRNEGRPGAGGRVTDHTLDRFEGLRAQTVVSWCPSCQLHLGETLHGYRATRFDLDHISTFLHERIDGLSEHFVRPLEQRVILHAHTGMERFGRNVEALLRAIPGLTLIETVLESGYTCGAAGAGRAPKLQASEREALLARVRATGAEVLVSLYHGCHRSLLGDLPREEVKVRNFTDLLVEALGGTPHEDLYRRYALLDDWRLVVEESAPFLRANGADVEPEWLAQQLPEVFAMAEFAGGLACFGARR